MTRLLPSLVTAALLGLARFALADGGTVQLSQVSGPYRVTLLTSPTPLRAGQVDVSAFVSDARSGDDVRDARIELSFAPLDGSAEPETKVASADASSTGLFQVARFNAHRSGAWQLAADVNGRAGRARVSTELTIAPPIPRWTSFLGWILAPIVPITVYMVRAIRGGARRRTSGWRAPFRTSGPPSRERLGC